MLELKNQAEMDRKRLDQIDQYESRIALLTRTVALSYVSLATTISASCHRKLTLHN